METSSKAHSLPGQACEVDVAYSTPSAMSLYLVLQRERSSLAKTKLLDLTAFGEKLPYLIKLHTYLLTYLIFYQKDTASMRTT